MLGIPTCVSAVCNPGKVILLERCTGFLGAQTLLGGEANSWRMEKNNFHSERVSLEQCLITESLSF